MNKALPKFENEALLQQAIAALLTRIPGISEVQILQGAQEYGKDIVFRAVGPLGEIVYCACVIKNRPLTGKVGTQGSLRAVYDQIEQALDTPFWDGSGESRRIQRVYVMTPIDISVAAIAAISGKLVERSGQVIFKSGSNLLEMFLQYWPEFFADEQTLLASYEARLEEAGRSTTALSVFSLESGLGAVPDKSGSIYVEPSFSRELIMRETIWPDEWIFKKVPDDAWSTSPKHWSIPTESWSRARLKSVETTLDETIRVIDHCATWKPLDKKLKRVRTEIPRLVSQLNGTLRNGIMNAVKEGSGNEVVSYNQIDSTASVALLTKDRAAISATLDELGRALEPLRNHVQRMVRRVNSFAKNKSDENILNEILFREACVIDDCFRAYVGSEFKIVGRRVFGLGKNLHRRYTGPLLIEGGPGTGKTSFCRWNALADATRLVAGKEKIIPAYVPLHELANLGRGTFNDVFLSRIGRTILIPEHLIEPTMMKRLYLDGLDEVTSPGRRKDLMEIAQSGSTSRGVHQIVVTVRDYVREPWLSWATRVALSGLEPEELRELAMLWLDRDEAAASLFMLQVSHSSSLSAVARVPLLATVMILVYKRTGRVPENRATLYAVFVNLLCGGWDLAKGIMRTSHFTVNYKIGILNSVASQLHEARVKEFRLGWFYDAARRTVPRQSDWDLSALCTELIRDGILTRTGETLEFSHLSFQEYFAARYLLGDPDGIARNAALNAFIAGDDWWREVLAFYIALSGSPESVARWLISMDTHADPSIQILLDVLQQEFPDFDPQIVQYQQIGQKRSQKRR